jgi:hypothetical protein
VDPEQHRQASRAEIGREDVQVQLVVADDDRLRNQRYPAISLR